MADDLKRVGLVFKEEGAVDFKKTLQEINVEMNKNYNQFKLTQSQWDDSTKSTEKLRQEQEYLKNAYEIQADKVSTLRMQLSDLENAENKNITAIKKKQNELTNAEIKLQNYKNNLDKTTTSLDNIKNGFETTTEKLNRLNNEIKENESNFNLAKSQWNAMTKESEKLKTEQQYLTEAYRLQNEKLIVLKEQLIELESVEDKNTDAISKKKQEIIKTETESNNYNTKLKIVTNQLENFSAKMISTGEKIKNVGEKIEGAGNKMSAFSVATGTALLMCAKNAIDFEDAFTGVEKTVDGTEQQMATLKQGIRDMAKSIPSTTTEISAVAEAAGQLGIQTDNILSFSKAMIDLGNSTNLTADEAASQLAKFANIMQMSQKDFDRLGSSIVDLGNNFATTEADIVEMSMRLAGAGKQVGLSEGQVLGLATALSSVGIEAEMGGSAISKAMIKMQNAVELGGDKLNNVLNKTGKSLRDLELLSANNSKGFKDFADNLGMTSTELKQLITAGTNLEDFAKVSGKTAEQFKKDWKKDAAGALSDFIKGLGKLEDKGDSAIVMLSEMGLTEVRLRDSLLRAANAGDLFNKAIQTGTKAWEDNTALTNEANKRYDTLKSKIEIVVNKFKDLAIAMGEKLMPYIEKLLKKIEGLVNWFSNLSNEEVEFIMNVGLVITAMGPLLTIIGKLTSTIGGVINGLGTFAQAVGVVKGTVTTTSTAVNGFAGVISFITNPLGLAVIAIGAVATVLWTLGQRADENVKKMTEQINAVEKQKDALNQLKDAQKEYLDINLSEIDNVSKLKDELTKLVDENGRVKEGYKGRVSFILGELNNALGTEFSITDNIINKYKELTQSIDETIAKKKANIILNSMEEGYTNALKSRSDAIRNLAELEKNYSNNKQMIIDKEAEKLDLMKEKQTIFTLSRINQLNTEIQTLQANVNAYDEQKEKIIEYNTQITDYETTAAIIKEGNIEKIEELNQRFTNSYQKRKDDTIASLSEQLSYEIINLQTQKETYEKNQNEITENQIKESQERLKVLSDELKNATSTVDNSPEVVEAWKNLATNSYNVYYDTISPLDGTLKKKIEEMTGVVAEQTPELVSETAKMSEEVVNQIKDNPQFKQEAINNLTGLLNGLKDEELRELLREAGVQNIDKVIAGIKEGNLAEDEGVNILNSLNEGLKNKTWKEKLFDTARGIASALSGLLTIKANVNGDTSKLPGHKNGLDYVPHDDYVARLHKGERVLTKEENKEYTQEQKSNTNKKTYNSQKTENKFTMNVYCEKLNNEELDKIFNYINKRFGVEY